jgi:hypothetical protein
VREALAYSGSAQQSGRTMADSKALSFDGDGDLEDIAKSRLTVIAAHAPTKVCRDDCLFCPTG